MTNYTEIALQKLKESGLKITKPRQMVVELLEKSSKALSPYEMKDILENKNIKSDVVTIYRILDVLEQFHLAHKVLASNGYIKCSSENIESKKDFCHHYLVCSKCNSVSEVEGEDLSALEKKILKEHKFKITSHYLEFSGLCKNCNC